MLEKLKKDNFWFGLFLGFIFPVVLFTIIYFIDGYFSDIKKVRTIVQDHTKYVVAVFFNLLLFRIYMVNWKMDRTGKGLLAITLFWAIGYIILFHVLKEKYLFN